MMLIAGTVPIADLPLTMGTVRAEGKLLVVDGYRIPRTQGTGALIGAALATTEYLKLESPQVLIAGDTGRGTGTQKIYQHLIQRIAKLAPRVLALHYCLPNMGLMRRLCEAIDRCPKRPVMIADAGSMYAAKAGRLAREFDIFTPDASELAFLSDRNATHPAYISRHLFNTDIAQTPKLVEEAHKNGGAPEIILAKGSTDYVIRNGEILATIAEPDVPELEAIGGTGDTITGLVAALAYAGLELQEAAIVAARTNRTAGKLAGVSPVSKVGEIIDQFNVVFKAFLQEWRGRREAG